MWGALIAAPPTILLGFSSSVVSDYLLLLIIGFAWEMLQVSGRSAMQLEVPPQISGRMVGIFYVIVTGASAVGALIAGWLFSELGVDSALIGVGTVALVCAVVLYLRGRRIGPATLAASGGSDRA